MPSMLAGGAVPMYWTSGEKPRGHLHRREALRFEQVVDTALIGRHILVHAAHIGVCCERRERERGGGGARLLQDRTAVERLVLRRRARKQEREREAFY